MADLALRLGRGERDDVEWKRDGEDRNLLRKAVCALANDLPGRGGGHLLVGVRNDGTPTGLTVNDGLILQFTNIRDEARVLPLPVMTVEKAMFAGGECVRVWVEAAGMRPVRFDGVVWVRVGTSTRRATREEELVLAERSRAGDVTFDQRSVGGTAVGDLDVELFRSTHTGR